MFNVDKLQQRVASRANEPSRAAAFDARGRQHYRAVLFCFSFTTLPHINNYNDTVNLKDEFSFYSLLSVHIRTFCTLCSRQRPLASQVSAADKNASLSKVFRLKLVNIELDTRRITTVDEFKVKSPRTFSQSGKLLGGLCLVSG